MSEKGKVAFLNGDASPIKLTEATTRRTSASTLLPASAIESSAREVSNWLGLKGLSAARS